MKVRATVVLLAMVAGLVQGSARAAEPVGCSWPLKFDVDTLNAAFPDRNATYWITRFEAVPNTRLIIHGTYPHARYFSFHAYDEAQHPIGSIADLQILPDQGSANPFAEPGAQPEGRYTVQVEFSAAPAVRAPNTVYAGQTDLGTPNPSGFFIYRVYVADDPADPAGNVPLPSVTLASHDGSVSVPLGQCEPQPPSTGGALNEMIKDGSFPDEIPRQAPWPPAQFPPKFVRFYSTEGAVLDRFGSNPATDAFPRSKGGYLSNQHIAYLYALISRQYGDLFVFRAKAPRAPDTRGGASATDAADVRYWSICENEFASQRFVDCKADFETAVDAQGYFTFVVSDPSDKPSARMEGVTWLPWGGAFYDGNVIYRHMLPSSAFAGAIQNVAEHTDAAAAMGDYFPRAGYCSKERFESGGAAACLG